MLKIILIETQLPENLGAVARVMANFGLTDLRLVNPHVDPLDPKALATSVHAYELLYHAKVFNTFEDSIKDLLLTFATTASYRSMVKTYETPRSFIHSIKGLSQEPVGIIFGPERTGLTNDHIARCYKAITIPVNINFSSLNLAQAVAIVAYEWYQQKISLTQALTKQTLGKTQIATQLEIKKFLDFLEENLDKTRFWRVDSKKPTMWRNLQNFFTRISPTQQDLKTLYGIIDALRKSE